ncbi:glycoside hydrolase family 25 protein [Kordia sp.]|uniref:glycoside hydrolase family 25 protein n=1 Tax=Kordia sp. TaxID=1965332 RepID=UPI003D6BBFCB
MDKESISNCLNELFRKNEKLSFKVFLEEYFRQNKQLIVLLFHVEFNQAILYIPKEYASKPYVNADVFQEFMNEVFEMNMNEEIAFTEIWEKVDQDIIIFSNVLGIDRVEDQKIVFSKGYYTNDPMVIKDAHGKVAYQGTFLSDETCEYFKKLINQEIKPTVTPSKVEEIQDILVPQAKNTTKAILPEEKKNITDTIKKEIISIVKKKHRLLVALTLAALILVLGLIIFLSIHIINHNPQIDTETKELAEIKPVALNFQTTTSKDYSGKNIQYGLDISDYNGDIVSLLNTRDSLHFVICKATQGNYYTDPDFASNWKQLKEKGIIRGAYHFYDAEVPPILQAKYFLNVIGELEDHDIAPIVDIEELGLNGEEISKTTLQRDLVLFLQYVTAKTTRSPIIYVDTAFANYYLHNKEFANYRLYLASWTQDDFPELPTTWQEKGLFLWQKSDSYHFENTIDDLDVFFGDLKELYLN